MEIQTYKQKVLGSGCQFCDNACRTLGGSDALAAQITGLIMAGASVVAYIIGEGLADAANAKKSDSATESNAEQKEGDGKTTESTPDTPSETAADNADETKQNSD